MHSCLIPAVVAIFACSAVAGPSLITSKLDDPRAVYLSGSSDDLQAAIDKAEGIVFIPSGRYTITKTIYLKAGVRLFGFGPTRPVFVLPPNTPGFQKGMGVMVMAIGFRFGGPNSRVPNPVPGTVPQKDVSDANPGTFYTAISNIDFEIGEGNPAAVGVRFHAAQHAYLEHMDFRIGSGLAGIYQVGNQATDLHFYGGRYGILAEKPSPAWQFTLIDSTFEGQRDAAIREHEAGLTLIRDTFRNVPVGIEIDKHYYDQLYSKDCRFENVSRAAVIISAEKSRLNEIGFENAMLSNTPVFALFRESGKKLEGNASIHFNHGVILPKAEVGTLYKTTPLGAKPEPAILPLPPSTEWTNVRSLGVTGDGKTDDTAALQKAIESHRVLYLPSGKYMVSDTLHLKPDTVIIGLHPTLAQIDLAEDSPKFRDIGPPRAVIEAPRGGTNILSGFGVYTGGVNPRAVGVLWRAGERSLINDVRFLGGHGSGVIPYNANQTADPDTRKRWDGQYPSLWVTDGGGGTFADIWTPNTFSQSGLYVSDTKTPGHVYEMSAEHHVRTEIKLERVENWELLAPQTEEESGESPEALALEIADCKNILIANLHSYRVTRTRAPYPAAVRVYNSANIRFRNVHVNAESGISFCDAAGCGTYLRASKYPYENSIQDVTHHLDIREREFAVLDLPTTIPSAPTRVKKLEDGFFSIAGGAVDATGRLFFVDRHQQRIYSWSSASGLTIERDAPLDPVNLAFDKSGNLIVLSSYGSAATVYTFKPGTPVDQMTVLSPENLQPRPGARILLPVNYWVNGEFKDQLNLDTYEFRTLADLFRESVSKPAKKQYTSPDGSLILPAARVVNQGPPDHRGWRFSDTLDTHGFLSAAPGDRVYVSNESEDITYSARVNTDGTLTDLKPFADRGGESVTVDAKGNVYVANGQIFIYNQSGKQIDRIDVPERPLHLIFGGRTLFILTHHTLYSYEIR